MDAKPFKIPESVLVVIHTPGLEVLLIERADKPGYWQSVTGSKDHLDEPLPDVCIREVAEETGIVVGSPQVPLGALHDWQMANDYEIYPFLALMAPVNEPRAWPKSSLSSKVSLIAAQLTGT